MTPVLDRRRFLAGTTALIATTGTGAAPALPMPRQVPPIWCC